MDKMQAEGPFPPYHTETACIFSYNCDWGEKKMLCGRPLGIWG